MATQPTPAPQPAQSPAPDASSGAGSPSPSGSQGQGQASDIQMLLAKWYQAAKQMGSADPRLASGANKVAEGIQEMQSALITPQQQAPASQQPSYS